MRTSRFAGIVVAAAAAVAPVAVFAEGSAQLNIRGLNPELEPIYAAASTAGELSCGDGTGKTVPFSAINDEFCDCPGTNADEPGTSACAGLSVHNFPGIAGTPATAHQHGDGAPDARGGSGGASAPVVFHCRNRGHHALSLPPSRVDDGHCDCCDGSDEPLARACGDSCRALGADTVRRLREELTNAEAALAIREQRIVEGRAEANARVEERTEAERALAEATSARAVMHERVMVAEEAESAERERRQKASDDEFQAQQQQQQQQQQQEQQAAEAAAAASEATAAAEGSGVAEAEAEAEKPAAPEPPKIEYSDPEADKLREERKRLDGEISKFNKQLEELKEIDSIDAGPDGAYASMIDKCFTHDAGQYRYELCLFDKVTQSGQDLGSYVGWKEGSNFREMEYKDGGHCWQGPKRSTLVKLTCSDKEEIVSIEEPSKCVYTMEFKTVSACNPAHVNALKLELMHLEGDDQ